ncbi:amino acid ABC transporter substrate-binding protein [Catenulispora rubra]|uniref:amino acid ABC transporter substrate-binding protein n=1 Tax=Catenulispora rubra TaxID=280293 RepID=UPI001892515E|nr:amino acid ABC transporter substrate-binding protein [Catenulispora rubra]
MDRRNRFLSPAALLAAVVVVAGVGACAKSTGSSTGRGAAAGKTSGPLVIGASLSLTGDFADSGKAVQRGYQLWADTVNKSGGILGRQVTIKVVDDASSTDQVVTNYQNLINRDHADLVFGPFSSLLTVPASQVAKRYGYAFIEPAGGGPAVFDQKLGNLFFVQPAPVVQSGEVFADWILSLPADQRPKTAAYAELDDPFSAPIAEDIRARFEAAGIRTVYKQVYAAETLDLGPVMAKVAAANPDVVVSGTQSSDAYSQVKSMVQLKFSPKFLFMSNGANSPVEFPDKVGAGNVAGVFSAGDWYPATKAPGSAEFASAYLAKYGGTIDQIDNSTAEAYAAGQLVEDVAKQAGKIDNATVISTLHSGSWPTVLGTLSWDAVGRPQGAFTLVEWENGKLTPVYPADRAQAAPVFPKPNWGG